MKRKIYELIGRATVWIGGWILAEYIGIQLLIYILDNCCTTLR